MKQIIQLINGYTMEITDVERDENGNYIITDEDLADEHTFDNVPADWSPLTPSGKYWWEFIEPQQLYIKD